MPAGRIRLDQRTVSGHISRHLAQALQVRGVGPAEFAQRTGISQAELANTHARISASKHQRCIELVGQFDPDPGLFDLLDNGMQFLFSHFTALANLCVNGRSLRSALRYLLEFRGLIGEFDFLLSQDNGEQIRFEYISEFASSCSGMQAVANFANVALITRCYDAPHHRSTFQLGLMGPAPGFVERISAFFGQRVRFEQSCNTLSFGTARLDLPFAHFNAALSPWLEQHARADLQQIQQMHCFSAGVERLIQTLLNDQLEHADPASLLQQLCQQLNTTRWTLHRQLQQEGTSFKALELKIKMLESSRLLRDTRFSVAEISEQLGFSSQSAFTRFFKTRYAMPPAAYRHQSGTLD